MKKLILKMVICFNLLFCGFSVTNAIEQAATPVQDTTRMSTLINRLLGNMNEKFQVTHNDAKDNDAKDGLAFSIVLDELSKMLNSQDVQKTLQKGDSQQMRLLQTNLLEREIISGGNNAKIISKVEWEKLKVLINIFVKEKQNIQQNSWVNRFVKRPTGWLCSKTVGVGSGLLKKPTKIMFYLVLIGLAKAFFARDVMAITGPFKWAWNVASGLLTKRATWSQQQVGNYLGNEFVMLLLLLNFA